MEFTYGWYLCLLSLLKEKGYVTCSYDDWAEYERCAILRHDVDNSLEAAGRFAELENAAGVKSTYFVLVTSDFYNVFSDKNKELVRKIISHGHSVGLHFDETAYPECRGKRDKIISLIKTEAGMLETVTELPVTSVSMHRPSKEILEMDLAVPGMVNSYSNIFFHEFKYLSDSRRRWREPVMDIVSSGMHQKLHILTHAFWYGESQRPIEETVHNFVNRANRERYLQMQDNITDLEKIMLPQEVM